jgi:hypothetical protein
VNSTKKPPKKNKVDLASALRANLLRRKSPPANSFKNKTTEIKNKPNDE